MSDDAERLKEFLANLPKPPAVKPVTARGHCRHYSYVRHGDRDKDGPRCAVGLDLRAKPGASLCCMPDPHKQGRACEPCDWREEHTAEEFAAWQKFEQDSMTRMVAIMALIPGSTDRREQDNHWGETGELSCPACGGTVRWTRARSNGHLHARCSTPNCFGVMQ